MTTMTRHARGRGEAFADAFANRVTAANANASPLREHFDELFVTPDAVDELDRVVLQLAVQGKLVAQDAKDETAQILYSRIQADKAYNENHNQLATLPKVSDDEIPFVLPSSWIWARLGDVTNYGTSTRSKNLQFTEDTWVLDLEDIEKESSRLLRKVRLKERHFQSEKNVFSKGDVVYGKLRPYLDKVIVADEDGICSSELVPIRGYGELDSHYLRLTLKRPDFIKYVNQKTYGVKMPRLGTKDARLALIPLPPLVEQHRIVARVEQLFAQTRALREKLVHAQTELERLNKAALAHLLNAETLEEFAERWSFIAENFDTLYVEPAHIAPLRQAILELAVRGKLTRREPEDEPASQLLERIRQEKNKLAQEEKNKSDALPPIQDDEKPFELPAGWEWVRFGEITINRDGERIPLSKEQRETRQGEYDYYGASGVIDKIDDFLFDTPLLLIGEDGANLVNRSTPIAFIADGKYWVNNHAHVLGAIEFDLLRYLEVYINAIDLKPYVTGTAQPKMNQAKMNSIVIALPPLTEHHRIVARVEQLMKLCDALEGKLASAQGERERLTAALLAGIG
ncbi:MAG: restriction endonuclease subunit S [Chloroflexota bacterium]|nr:MAG: restriction endonuclease subunit S [Chloroflexota bacterium]